MLGIFILSNYSSEWSLLSVLCVHLSTRYQILTANKGNDHPEHHMKTNGRWETLFQSVCLLLDSFPPIEQPCPALIWGHLPCVTVSCFVMLPCCLLEACSFVQGIGEEWIWERGNIEESRMRWEGKLCSGYIIWEKNPFS